MTCIQFILTINYNNNNELYELFLCLPALFCLCCSLRSLLTCILYKNRGQLLSMLLIRKRTVMSVMLHL